MAALSCHKKYTLCVLSYIRVYPDQDLATLKERLSPSSNPWWFSNLLTSSVSCYCRLVISKKLSHATSSNTCLLPARWTGIKLFPGPTFRNFLVELSEQTTLSVFGHKRVREWSRAGMMLNIQGMMAQGILPPFFYLDCL